MVLNTLSLNCLLCFQSSHSIGLMWWLLAREVLRLRGVLSREQRWDVVVDLFFYRDPEESEKEEQQAKEQVCFVKLINLIF